MTIAGVGTAVTTHVTGATTLSVTAATVGNLWVLRTELTSTSISVSSVSGGGVTTWQRGVGPYNSLYGQNQEIWYGGVTSTGASTITVTFSSSNAAIATTLSAQQFSQTRIGAFANWTLEASGTKSNTPATTSVTYPTLVPSGGRTCLYVGTAYVGTGSTTGATSGYTYQNDGNSDPLIYNPAISASTSPTSTCTSSTSDAIAVLLGEPRNSVTDTFNRADSATSLGTADSGQTYTKSVGSVNVGINTNQAYASAVGNADNAIDTGFSDVNSSVTLATLTAGDNRLGLNVRWAGIGVGSGYDAYYFLAEVANSRYVIMKFDGAETFLATGGPVPASGDFIRVIAVGPRIDCYVNGARIFSVTDTFNQTKTWHGFTVNSVASTTRFDNLSIIPGALSGALVSNQAAINRSTRW